MYVARDHKEIIMKQTLIYKKKTFVPLTQGLYILYCIMARYRFCITTQV